MSLLLPVVNYPNLYVDGFQMYVSGNTTIVMYPGRARNSTNEQDIIIPDTTTIDCSRNGLNGLDTGSLQANKMYSIYAIAEQTNAKPSGYIVSLSASNPKLPDDYTTIRLIRRITTDSAVHFRYVYVSPYGQAVRYQYRVTPTVLSAGHATSATAIDLSAVVPIVNAGSPIESFNAVATFQYFITPHSVGNRLDIGPTSSLDSANIAPVFGQVASQITGFNVTMSVPLVSSVPTIYYKVTESTDTGLIVVQDFTDFI